MDFFLQLLISGLVIGSIYALVGLGFVIIYKSSSILNFAQGEFLMLGAYVCVALVGGYRVPLWAAFPLTLGFFAVMGVLMERLLLREEGLPRRPWYKHLIYAPGFYTGYSVKTVPGVREAIEEQHWKEVEPQIELVAGCLHQFAEQIGKATRLLEEGK